MDFGKIEKVDLKTVAIRSAISPLRIKIESLLPGEAFMVTGVDRENIMSITGLFRKEGRKFITRRQELGKFRVIRVK